MKQTENKKPAAPALTIEARENQMISLADEEAERRFFSSRMEGFLYEPIGTLFSPLLFTRQSPLKHVLFKKMTCAALFVDNVPFLTSAELYSSLRS